MSNLTTTNKNQELAIQLNQSVLSVLGAENVVGFEKSYQIANAISFLRENLTNEYMSPIMALQNSKLGFKTDNKNGYSQEVVKDCVIDAVLTGVQPYGNQFNIIAGQMYVTKEGYGYLLSKVKGLKYAITPQLPRINTEKGSAAVEMLIKWNLNNEQREERVDFAIKVNNYMGADAVIGKATRKARAWLFNQVSDIEVSDGDVDDVDVTIISTNAVKVNTEISQDEKELERFKETLASILTLEELKDLEQEAEFSNEEKALIDNRKKELSKKTK